MHGDADAELARHFASRPDGATHPLGGLWDQLSRSRRDAPALLALAGDAGARSVIAAHASVLQRLDCDDPGAVTDVDTPEDYRNLTGEALSSVIHEGSQQGRPLEGPDPRLRRRPSE